MLQIWQSFPLQWLTTWRLQLLYLTYRWVLLLYFLSWLLVVTIQGISGVGSKFFIYLTNWGFIVWNAYLFVAVVSTTLNFCRTCCVSTDLVEHNEPSLHCTNSSCCCGITSGNITWKEKIHWALFTISTEFAVSISILFWIYFSEFNLYSLHVHMINGIVAILDLWITGIPIRLLHVAYVLLFGTIYILFTGLYYIFNGKNICGNRFIYPMLDYGSNLGAVSLLIGYTLGYLTIVHLIFFFQYLARHWITSYIHRKTEPLISAN